MGYGQAFLYYYLKIVEGYLVLKTYLVNTKYKRKTAEFSWAHIAKLISCGLEIVNDLPGNWTGLGMEQLFLV